MKTIKPNRVLYSAIALTLTLSTFASTSKAQVNWLIQDGTAQDDVNHGIEAKGNNIYSVGRTTGSLDGPNVGDYDNFITKYDNSGNSVWSRQWGTSAFDAARAAAIDNMGNVFTTGYTNGSLAGANAGSQDAFLTKFDSSGNLLWNQQLGSIGTDRAQGVGTDNVGNVYIAGRAGGSIGGQTSLGGNDGFVSKYDTNGNLQWTRHAGTALDDRVESIATDGLGNSYVFGETEGTLSGTNAGSQDVFIQKYDTNGNLTWTRQFGSSDYDDATDIWVGDNGNVYFSGTTFGSLASANLGGNDAYVGMYDSNGNLQWVTQYGTAANDYGNELAVDAAGDVFVGLGTEGNYAGPIGGVLDFALTKFDGAGNEILKEQLSNGGFDESSGMAFSGSHIYFSGNTEGSLAGANAGQRDAFIGQFQATATPEPGTALLTLVGIGITSGVSLRRRRRS